MAELSYVAEAALFNCTVMVMVAVAPTTRVSVPARSVEVVEPLYPGKFGVMVPDVTEAVTLVTVYWPAVKGRRSVTCRFVRAAPPVFATTT